MSELLTELLSTLAKQTQAIEELQKQVKSSQHFDPSQIAKSINTKISGSLTQLQEKSNDISKKLEIIPKSVVIENKKSWRFEMPWQTGLWISFIVLLLGFMAINRESLAQWLDQTDKISNLKYHLKYHIDRNPKTEEQFWKNLKE